MAARADCDGTLARSYGHLDALLVGTEVSLLVDKTPETMAAVQDRDQFHGEDGSGRRNLHHKNPSRTRFASQSQQAVAYFGEIT